MTDNNARSERYAGKQSLVGIAARVMAALTTVLYCAVVLAVPTDFRVLFATAIDAPNGVVKSEVQGPLLKKIQSEVHTDARVFVEVRAIQVLPQPGCKRLQVTFSSPDSRLPTRDGGSAPLSGVGFALNMCRDGNPPGIVSGRQTSGLDR